MEDLSTDQMKCEITQYIKDLQLNKNRWFLQQIKHGILMGQLGLRVCALPSKGYKKGKHILNFWKKIDSKYYFKDLNILITDKNAIKTIDFITEVGLSWFLTIEWSNNSSFSHQIYTLYAKLL